MARSPTKVRRHLTGVLNNLAHKLAALDIGLDLLWHRDLARIVLVLLRGQHNIDARAFAGEDLGALHGLLAQEDRCTVYLVEHDGRKGPGHLGGKVGGLDDVDAAYERLDEDLCAWAVVDRDGVGLALEDDRGLVALGDKDGLLQGDLDLDWLGRRIPVLDQPLVSVKFLLAFRLLRRCWGAVLPHARWLRLNAWARTLTPARFA